MNGMHRSTPSTTAQPPQFVARPRQSLLRRERIAPAFWTIASTLSLIVNLILILIVIILATQLFNIKQMVNNQLIGGLYNNFVLMDQAHIRTTIPIKTNVPAKFDLPLKTDTVVTLTQDTYIQGASVTINSGYVTINNAPTNIVLPAGTQLPVHLELNVPVDQKIPVELMVNVDIPLKQTELHKPFVGLQSVLGPYHSLLGDLPDSWTEAMCGKEGGSWCAQLIP